MNLFQFFYAFLLGLMFGYVYTRTSKLRYSTAMHMIINFNGGVLAPWVSDARRSGPAGEGVSRPRKTAMRRRWNSGRRRMSTGLAIMLVYFVLYGAVILAGFVLLIRNFKKFEFYTAPEELPRGTRAKTVCGNVGMIMFIMVTCMLTAVNLLM